MCEIVDWGPGTLHSYRTTTAYEVNHYHIRLVGVDSASKTYGDSGMNMSTKTPEHTSKEDQTNLGVFATANRKACAHEKRCSLHFLL